MGLPRRWWALSGAVAVVAAVLVYSATRPAPRPLSAEVASLVGAPLSEPQLHRSGWFRNPWRTVRAWWTYYTLPVPNQMFMAPPDGSWTYTFESDPPFSPPPSSPLRCQRQDDWGVSCRAEGAGWTYVVDYSAADGVGTLTAMPAADRP